MVETPTGQRLLVDCGDAKSQAAERAILPYLRRANIRHLEAVIITHDHDDHRGGLPALRRSVAIRQVLTGAELQRGQGLSTGGLTIATLWPEKSEEPPATGGTGNDDSIVLRLSYCGRSVMLCGGIEAEAESRLAPAMARGPAVDLLKVAHHGGRNSSTAEFLTAVRPRLAVISVGANNRFGHPHPDALSRLTTAGAWVLRTDRSGAIRVAVNADGITVWRWAGRGWRRLTTGVTASAANRTTHGLHLCQR
jgi:competence protein ComEC